MNRTDQIQTEFLAVAKAALARGFSAVTVLPNNKSPEGRHGWNAEWRLANEFDIEMAARFHPHDACGVVMHREVHTPFCIDIDTNGVLDRIPQRLPDTYRVFSRPDSAAWKQHIFFLHTEYSVSRFKSHHFCGDFDLIGTGLKDGTKNEGGLQVVAEGCVRPPEDDAPGEVRKGNGKKIAPVPNWLVDWLIEEVTRLALNRKRTNKAVKLALAEANPTILTFIPKGERQNVLQQRAEWFVKLGLPREKVLEEIIRQCIAYAEDGVNYARIRRKDIRKWVFNPKVRHGNPMKHRRTKTFSKRKDNGGIVITTRRMLSAKDNRLLLVKKMSDEITPEDAYAQLGLDQDIQKEKMTFSRSMRDGGFDYDKTTNLWTRNEE